MRRLLVSLLLLSLALVIPTYAQNGDIVYNNGMDPCPGGCVDAWQINDGIVTSDTIFLTANAKVTGFDIWAWEFPMDRMLRIQWSITSSANGGTVYGSGNVPVQDHFIALNEYGFDIDKVTVTGLNVRLAPGTYWFNLAGGVTEQHYPVYWDENSGYACSSPGCPSLASNTLVGTIPSEAFDVHGIYGPGGDEESKAPTPRTLVVLTSGLLGLGLMVRRQLL